MGKEPPDYDWLYGADGPPGDPDPTRVLPVQPRRGAEQPPPPPRRLPPAAPAPRGRGRGGRRRPRWLRVLVAVLALWVVFLVVVPLLAWQSVEKVDATSAGDRPDKQPGTTYLLVGSDSREGLTARQRRRFGTGDDVGRRTDTIMLLHVGSGPNLLLSIPRDSIVEVPGYGTTKINAAYAFGGAPLLVETLERATGIRVDNYVEIGFAGFVGLVNAVGGIEICPETDMRDPLANLDIKAGCQEAGGRKALGYARSRKLSNLGDIDRARRQREVVSAVGREAASPWSFINPVRYYRLANAAADFLVVGEDTGPINTARFAWAMTRVDGESGLTCSMPIRDLAVNWDPERSQQLFRLIAEDRTDEIPNRLCRPSGLAD
ncbi:LCP family protein [Nocardioides massiliensis]|uniref:LCP family protein required for cell wall assembly n=1 Tax=Nocardioides massiliensis TaxID=1325935 RepID=A0ABT9NUU7_9ACTN|nr:LCP family protein [Nocardioides massiliensis]MDP9824203.1 LCP family protein required for cell wall assembly [Nocardioides massiliensis]